MVIVIQMMVAIGIVVAIVFSIKRGSLTRVESSIGVVIVASVWSRMIAARTILSTVIGVVSGLVGGVVVRHVVMIGVAIGGVHVVAFHVRRRLGLSSGIALRFWRRHWLVHGGFGRWNGFVVHVSVFIISIAVLAWTRGRGITVGHCSSRSVSGFL